MILRSAILPLAAIAVGALTFLVPVSPVKADPGPFNTLLGSWGGSGEIRLDKGRKERIKCNAYYTGGGSDLGLAIRCQSDNYKIEIRSKLSYSGGRLSGNWEERTFNASGTASGTAYGTPPDRCRRTWPTLSPRCDHPARPDRSGTRRRPE